MLIAVGFLRAGPWEHTAMSVAAVTRQQFLDDVTHHVGVTILGQGLRCASCHDHKFDPVPTRDYYRLQAVFAPTQFAERHLPFLPEENVASFAAGRRQVARRQAEVEAVLEGLRQENEAAVAALVKQRGLKSASELPRADAQRRDDLGLSRQELSVRKIYQKRQQTLERER